MSQLQQERRSASPTDLYKHRPSVQDDPYPQQDPQPANTSSADANSATPTVSQDQDLSSQASSSSQDDPSMDFQTLPYGPRRATWAGEPAFYGSHFRPEFTQPPTFSQLDAAEALSHLPLATKFAEPDGPSLFPLPPPTSALLAAQVKRSSSLAVSTVTSGKPTSSQSPPPESPSSAYRYESFSQVPKLPPILQVERTRVTTTATQAASAQRRRNDATFKCPVPGHLRSHTEEKPYICQWPECAKGFARQHDCKRHQALHTSKSAHLCQGCEKSFSRMDALNRHLRSSDSCREKAKKPGAAASASGNQARSTVVSSTITNSPATSQSSVRPYEASASGSPEADDQPSPAPSGYNSV
ncbi:hypothetical protein FRB90_010717 [Tulasnella sp. 427]|nr:hypothetical protein FRB90_010717 [Tulasnella sp. 427]